METKAAKVNTRTRLLLACAIAIAAVLAVIVAASRVDIPSGLSRQQGRLEYYESAATGASLALLRSGDDAWGFFEWPVRRVYGFFSGKSEGGGRGEIKAALRSVSGRPLNMTFPAKGASRTMRLHLEDGEKIEEDIPFQERKLRDFSVESFAGMIGADGRPIPPFQISLKPLSIEDGSVDLALSFFHIDALGGSAANLSELADKKLRRGRKSLDYAREHWRRFGEVRRAAEGTGTGNPSRVFVERQYMIPYLPQLYSIATERYVYSGGAHGNTTMVFETINIVKGTILKPSDLFADGWEKPIAEKIRAEALRAFSDSPGETETSLRAHGFFDETIHPSTSFFLCETGVGFHYDRYELAPYSAGDFTFVLPWNELNGLLRVPAMAGF